MVAKWVLVMGKLKLELQVVEEDIKTIIRRQNLLGFSIAEFPQMEILKNEIKPVLQLWESVAQYDAKI